MVVGVAWYRPEQYGLLLALSTDSDKMEKTYDDWHRGVTKLMQDLQQRGVSARKIDVDVRELSAWCEQRGRSLDGAARAEFATEKLSAK